MNNYLPDDWEPGNNHGWKGGQSARSKLMAAGLLLVLAAMSFVTICAALFFKAKGY
jgi:hypothetical protein